MIDHALTLSLGMFCVALLLTCWRLLAGPWLAAALAGPFQRGLTGGLGGSR